MPVKGGEVREGSESDINFLIETCQSEHILGWGWNIKAMEEGGRKLKNRK